MSSHVDLQRRFYDMLMASQYWSPERMQQHQRTQLAQLLRHAKAQVPFYETRLDAVLKPNGDIDWDHWNEIPVVTRLDMTERREVMQARALPDGHGPVRVDKSSGSTGMPIETTHNILENHAGNAALLRAYQWHGIDFDKRQLVLTGDNPDVAAWPDGLARGVWGPLWARGNGVRHDLNILTSPEHAAEFIATGSFSYVSALPSRLEAIAYAAEERGLHLKAEALLTRGESASSAQQKLFGAAFGGARNVSFYSSSETFKMAHGCPDHDHYHVHAELGLVEIVGEDGRQMAPGERGRVIVTPFYNTAQPLIRYDLGDIATAGAMCSCGRTLPVIEKIDGRTYHLFKLANGHRFVPVVPIDQSFDLGIGMWQLAQMAPDQSEFRYVARPHHSVDTTKLKSMLRQSLPPELSVSLVALERFELSPNRKHLSIVNESADGMQAYREI